jgi:hypothetical protein
MPQQPAEGHRTPTPGQSAALHRRSFLGLASGAALAGPAVALAGSSPAAATVRAATSVAATGKTSATGPAPATHAAGEPDFGPNVYVFDGSMSAKDIQSTLDDVFARQQYAQFGEGRYALLFKPGAYDVNVRLGYYTHVAGLGLQPAAASITGSVYAGEHGNATVNFWRGVENLNAVPSSGQDTWAVSQGTFYRRIYLLGNLRLSDGGYSSGGFIADCQITGQVDSGTQQQWLTRDSMVGQWLGSNWNIVFAGVAGAPSTSFPTPPYTSVNQAPVSREKPVLYVDSSGAYQVFVPALRRDSRTMSWFGRTPAGRSIPISGFHIAKPGDSAATLNAELGKGKHLLLTPGTYQLSEALQITRAGTVVLGLGYATLRPQNGTVALDVADVDGVQIAGILVEAGPASSPALIRIGGAGSHRRHPGNPSCLFDVFVRIGGNALGKARQSLVINSSDVIIDNVWLWRADHGSGVGWTENTADNGLVVNGDDVTAYGLFVEHYQKAQVVWNGERGRTYFFQNEMPYDPPSQAAWMDGRHRGYPAYQVGEHVREHEAWGLGSYCIFADDPDIVADRAIAAPPRRGVHFHSMITFSLGGGIGTIAHIINDAGGPSDANTPLALLNAYP